MGQSHAFYRFVLLPGFVGLACCACDGVITRVQTLPAESENREGAIDGMLLERAPGVGTSKAVSEVVPSSTVPAATALPSSTYLATYREGINLASSAYLLSQSAVSPDDWGLIAIRWQQAADHLKKVGVEDENYQTAQQKIGDYLRNAEHAKAKIFALEQSVTIPLVSTAAIAQTTGVANSTPRRFANPSNIISSSSAVVQPPRTNQAHVPIVRRLHGTPVVRVTFNQIKSYDMILDTGASRTLITRQMADELGIVATERMLATTASEAEVSFDIGRMSSMTMGDVTLQNARVGIGESVSIGLLGNDFLKGYDVTIRDRDVELSAAE